MIIEQKPCKRCKHARLVSGTNNATGKPLNFLECHGGPPSGNAILGPGPGGQPVMMGVATVWPRPQENDTCGAWAPAILTPTN